MLKVCIIFKALLVKLLSVIVFVNTICFGTQNTERLSTLRGMDFKELGNKVDVPCDD